ncbi:MAG: hypothetical protein H6738_09290 [Alphaproteobacteria bacterium]|nr:hypothetical protein [Alphaproteobacteria bacterium]
MITMLLAAQAFAHGNGNGNGGDARLRVDNHFDGEVEVLVDGRFVAMVPGDAAIDLQSRPGRHEVRVQRPGTGYVLTRTQLVLTPAALVVLPVEAPRTTIRIDNQGQIPLRLTLEGNNVWLVPRTVVELEVTSGNLDVTAMAHEPRGDFFAVERTVWVEPGQVASTVLRPDPTMIVVDNDDIFDMRVLVDGKDAGVVDGGDVRQIWVHPGPSVVTLIDPFGRIRSETRVVVQRGQESLIVVGDFHHDHDHHDHRPDGRPGDGRPDHGPGRGPTVVTVR